MSELDYRSWLTNYKSPMTIRYYHYNIYAYLFKVGLFNVCLATLFFVVFITYLPYIFLNKFEFELIQKPLHNQSHKSSNIHYPCCSTIP